jgi:hypothetical protein
VNTPSRGDLLRSFAATLPRYRTDPVAFCRDILGFEPHSGQADWLEAELTHADQDEAALVSGNRWGKSFSAAAKRIWKCAFQIGWSREMAKRLEQTRQVYQSINVSVTADQAQITWRNAQVMLQSPKASWLVKDIKLTPFPTITFINGSVFQARSTAGNGHHLLGHNYDDVNWDEAAYEPKFLQIRDNVLRMRLVDRAGRLDYTSTGNGRNEFGKFVLDGLAGREPDLYVQTGRTYDNPHISLERVAKNAERMSDRQREQNIEGAIIDAGGEFFSAEDLADACDSDLNDMLRVHALDDDDLVAWAELFPIAEEGVIAASRYTPWARRFATHRYVHAWDLADRSDWTVGTTWDISDRPRATMVEFERFHRKGWGYVKARIRERHRKYNTTLTGVDCTGVGDAILDDLADIRAEGMNFAGGRKDEGLGVWQRYINLRQVRWPSIGPWIDEHAFYNRDDKDLVTDCVMSGVVFAWFMRNGILMPPPASAYR